MYIKKISIKNIRSVSHLEMEFPIPAGWHVLIGDNGAGKSSVVRAITASLIGPEEINALLPIWSEWLRKGENSATIELELLPDWNFDVMSKGQPSKKSIINRFELNKGLGGNILLSTNADARKMPPTNYNWSKNKGWFSAAYGPFRRFTGGEEKRNKIFYAYPKAGAHLSVFGEEVALTEALDWLKELDRKRLKQKENGATNLLGNQNDAEILYLYLQRFINESGLLPHSAKFDSVGFEGDIIFRDGSGNEITVTQMSDGYRSILSLMFELIRQLVTTYSAEKVFQNFSAENGNTSIDVPGVVLIDEIDAHLHPTWQTRIGQWFTHYFPNIQFIVTTHSPLVCRACDKGSIWRLATPGSGIKSGEITGTNKKRLISGNVLDAYSTEVFGENVSIPKESDIKLMRLTMLNKKSIEGETSEAEEVELAELKSFLSPVL